jgi:hypothetical protein
MPTVSPFFSVCPFVYKAKGKLVARTPLYLQIWALGAFYREVIVDPKAQVVRVRRRYAWLFKRAFRIPFGSVRAVTYGYAGSGGEGGPWWGAYRTKDYYSVGLRLSDFREVHLFGFSDEGGFANYGPLPDWLYWQEYLLDLRGTQDTESRAYAEALSGLIGAPVEPPSS